MAQDLIQFIARKPNLAIDPDLQSYLDDHLIPGWRQALVSIGIKAENGDADAAKVASAMTAWVAALCRKRNRKSRRAKLVGAGLNVISMAKFQAARVLVSERSHAV
ncbi:hypothetical protein Msil_3153 [Methylocella silvestris BL2]|uniref:Uncharacterized protein n=1 Tax=Methylocella silvestris (strain DSM 15510 / CIP 108128 / LMG 27833 / NCIMB 13906 / BL2) TaxID=395965 RepID=B8EMD4_METSB|nr:hypothetical protein [Methylocella silvestris]ACK52062.1 hypothetical protein Msil_3153 [Methylocella silvestris BL2]